MLIFLTQVKNPDSEAKARFLKIKKKMGQIFKKIQKENKNKIVMKAGDNWFCVHSFAN